MVVSYTVNDRATAARLRRLAAEWAVCGSVASESALGLARAEGDWQARSVGSAGQGLTELYRGDTGVAF